jgi:hypothetical protein
MDMDINKSKLIDKNKDIQLLINIDLDFNRTIQNLVEKKEYFTPFYISNADYL